MFKMISVVLKKEIESILKLSINSCKSFHGLAML